MSKEFPKTGYREKMPGEYINVEKHAILEAVVFEIQTKDNLIPATRKLVDEIVIRLIDENLKIVDGVVDTKIPLRGIIQEVFDIVSANTYQDNYKRFLDRAVTYYKLRIANNIRFKLWSKGILPRKEADWQQFDDLMIELIPDELSNTIELPIRHFSVNYGD